MLQLGLNKVVERINVKIDESTLPIDKEDPDELHDLEKEGLEGPEEEQPVRTQEDKEPKEQQTPKNWYQKKNP